MSRGVFYSASDDQRLLNIYADNPNKKLIEVARLAQRYGICPERGTEALSQHISKLVNPPETEKDADQDIDPEIAVLKKALKITTEKYDSLIAAVIGSAKLYLPELGRSSLSLDFKTISRWIWTNEPELANARIEELQLEYKGADN